MFRLGHMAQTMGFFAKKLANINVSRSAAPKLPFVPACRYFRKKILKILLLRNRKEMTLKIGILALDIVLYKSYDFYSGQIETLVAMATYCFHRLTYNGKSGNWKLLLSHCG